MSRNTRKIGVSQNTVSLFIVFTTVLSWTAALCSAQSVPRPQAGPFFVATSGRDSNPGTLAQPFATLGKAQRAMQASSTIKTTYIRHGTYAPPAVSLNGNTYALYLTSADSGETWSYYPPDGYDSAILNGRSTGPGTGIKEMIMIDGGSGITINGLRLQNFDWIGIGVHGGTEGGRNFPVNVDTASGNIIKNNIIENGYGGSAEASLNVYDNGGIAGDITVPNTTVANNVIINQNGAGITFGTGGFGPGAGNFSGLTIANNVLLNSNTLNLDSAPICLQDPDSTSTNIVIRNNFIRDYGLDTTTGTRKGIYFDDGLSNATVSGNIIAGLGGYAFEYHGGHNDVVKGNIVDLEYPPQTPVAYQMSNDNTPMTGNSFTNNIIIAADARGGDGGYLTGNGTFPQADYLLKVTNNAYYNYAGGPVETGCAYSSAVCISDTNPVRENPQLSGWTYAIAPGSPVYNPPVSFPGIAGGWGPPGYVIPQTGTPPSSPH
jgi:hypothetical protein